MANFNPNELILERIVTVEGYLPATGEIALRNTQIETPNLATSATATDVVDAIGTSIMKFYQAQTGTFTYTNSLLSLDLAAQQLGSDKETTDAGVTIKAPASELLTIDELAEVELKYVPVGDAGAEIKTVTVVDTDGAFGKTFTVSDVAPTADTFNVDAATKTLTFADGTTGRVLVSYERDATKAVKISKATDAVPKTLKLVITALFHPPCDPNKTYMGYIICPSAQLDITDVQFALTSDGKHPVTYNLQKDYCAESATLFEIIVTED